MAEQPGRRERKRLATRQALIDAAVELFEAQGFDGTTVAQIAERADVTPRTFFLHFASKEDVLTGGAAARVELVLDVLSAPGPGEHMVDTLARAAHTMIDDLPEQEARLAWLRLRLAAQDQRFQASMFRGRGAAEARYAQALHRSFPEEVDELGATVSVAAVMEAMYAAGLVALRARETPEGVRAAMHRGVEIALRGLGGG
ncbi:helix-turn-helix domain-containing protein [Pseudonocardia sp. NPDC049635]|uniref:TetR/AcrR family transcriptional regulator n=1 Tax=Pseudonocardia sp. NPDC049635 TaxID=3155506 RepID=UPI0033F1BC4D